MPGLLERNRHAGAGAARRPGIPAADERAARAELRRQIGRLEHELSLLFGEAFMRVELDHRVPAAGGPRVLGLGELEQLRDALALRVGEARRALQGREAEERRNRELLRRMLADPAKHKWLVIPDRALGEPGCGAWQSRPRLGVIGMLMGWWRVKHSSGCP